MTVRSSIQCLLAILIALPLFVGNALAATDDRAYLLGDDSLEQDEGAAAGVNLGVANFGDGPVTLDSQGPSGSSAFLDISVNGTPTYVNVSDRPTAESTDLGAEFGGPDSGDYLATDFSLNQPSNMWNSPTLFPVDKFGLNYSGLFSHGIQLWAKPNGGTQDVRQDLVVDTLEHGIYISANNNWGLVYADASIESPEPVEFGEWAHVMELAGFPDPTFGQSDVSSALLVNGVAVAASGAQYGFQETPLSIGANQDGSGNFYHGVLDDVRLFFWGNNFAAQDPDGEGRTGQDWGALDLSVDNEWIANELEELGVTDPADVNLDGAVDNSDVTSFLPAYGDANLVNGVQVGDWISRQNGDLNYDGVVDLQDAFVLNDGLIAATGSGLDFSLLTASVPEPASATLALVAVLLFWGRRTKAGR